MFKSMVSFLRTVFCAVLYSLSAATMTQAVTIYLELETEGDPIPEATISFETVEGEEIDLGDLFEEVALESGEGAEEPSEAEEPEDKAEELEKPQKSVEFTTGDLSIRPIFPSDITELAMDFQ